MVSKAEPGSETGVGEAADMEGCPLPLDPWQTHGGDVGPLLFSREGGEGDAVRPRRETRPPRLGQAVPLSLLSRALWPQPYMVKKP